VRKTDGSNASEKMQVELERLARQWTGTGEELKVSIPQHSVTAIVTNIDYIS
jgi:hypothetical protein